MKKRKRGRLWPVENKSKNRAGKTATRRELPETRVDGATETGRALVPAKTNLPHTSRPKRPGFGLPLAALQVERLWQLTRKRGTQPPAPEAAKRPVSFDLHDTQPALLPPHEAGDDGRAPWDDDIDPTDHNFEYDDDATDQGVEDADFEPLTGVTASIQPSLRQRRRDMAMPARGDIARLRHLARTRTPKPAQEEAIVFQSSRVWGVFSGQFRQSLFPKKLFFSSHGIYTRVNTSVLFFWRQEEEMTAFRRIASVRRLKGLFWDSVVIETLGGTNRLDIDGLPKIRTELLLARIAQAINGPENDALSDADHAFHD